MAADYVISVGIEGDASDLQKAAQQAQESVQGLSDTAKTAGSQVEGAMDQQGRAATSFADTLKSAMGTAGGAVSSFVEGVQSGFSLVGGALSAVGDGIADFSGKVSNFGRNATILTAPIAAVGANGVKSFAEVDKTMALATKTMNATEDEADMLNDAMRDAASNSTFGMSDAAGAALNFARAGLNAAEAANAMAPAMNLAAGEGGDLNVVSAGLTATINGFGDSFENTGHYADVFAAACNNSALDVNSLSGAMSVAAPIFAASGKGVEDAALFMGVMANSGIEASVAANSLKTGMARLAKPAKEGAAAMEELGISAYNADGTMKDSVTLQRELHDAFSGLSEQEQMAAASAIFGKNQMSSWLALINTAPEDVEDLSASLEDCGGTTEDMANTMMSGFGGSIERLKSTFDVLSTTVGDLLADDLTPLIDKLQEACDWFLSLDEDTQGTIAMIGGVLAVIGPLAMIFGKVGQAVGGILGSNGLGGMIKALGLLPAPVFAVIAVVAALVGAFVYLWNTNEDFRNKVLEIWNQVKGGFEAFLTAVSMRLQSWGITWESVTGFLKGIWQGLCDFLAPVFIFVFQTIADYFQFACQFILGIMEIFHGLFTGNWSEVWNGVQRIFSAAWDFVVNLFENVCNMLGLDSEAIKQDISDKFNAVKDFLFGIWENIKDDASAAWELLKTLVLGPVLLLCDLVTGDFDKLKEDAQKIWEKIKENGGKLWEDFKDFVVETALALAEGIQQKITEIPGIVEDGFQGAIDFITSLPDEAFDWGSDIISSIADGIWDSIGWVQDAAASVADTIRGFLHFSEPDVGPLADFHTYMPDMMKGLAQGMKNNLPTLRAGVELVADTVAGVIPGTGTAGWYGGSGGDRVNNLGGVSIVVNGAPGQSEADIADVVMRRIMDLVIADG